MLKLVVVTLLIASCFSKNVLDQLTKKGDEILNEARTDRMIRECSCDEESECGTNIKGQVFGCFGDCWDNVKKITKHPDQLRQCLEDKAHILDDIINCMHKEAKTCVPDMNGPQITYIDINKIIDKADTQIHLQADKFTRTLPNSAKDLLDAAMSVATCVKTCFQKKNDDGFCFDKKECQLNIDPKDTRKALKKCSAKLEWQKEAAEMCDCALKAGVDRIKQYCDMIHTLTNRRSSHKKAHHDN